MKLPALIKRQKKTSTGLYTILGVSNDASTKEIQTSFRKLAKGCHPDLGGSEENFTTLLNAYRILRNLRKRKFYDKTGIVEEALINNDFAAMMEGIMVLFQSVLASSISEAPDVDLIEAMKQSITRNVKAAELEIEEMDKNLKLLKELKRRLVRKTEGPNLFTAILDKKISSILKSKKSAGQTNRILSLIREELDNYTCITEIVDIVQFYSFSSTSTSTNIQEDINYV